jgi:hypothetical protein
MNVQISNKPFAESFWLQTAVLIVLTVPDCSCGEIRLVMRVPSA